MEIILLAIIIFTFTILWYLIDLEERVHYEPIDQVEDDEKVVILYKKIKF
ncbi:hypothetical protein [Calidifontibacillus erzurumensis]|uniref:Uncharacterized protein n=1 Tax=Calidifontibacillus erzurumensis TaxID=2741433 RepID=A0A8J8KAT2_9BACI|nr:hypothetical protein [Calidifontibacillus erzurumensis]NSL50932.1 hypothetical protein [Calidifontibacillus erzurumensis]